eukprot:s6843_g1.t1
MVSLLGLVPAELQSHLELNLPRLNSYDLLRREIVTFAENRRAFTVDDSGAMPMEVDYANKGKGQGKGKKETRKCHRQEGKGEEKKEKKKEGKGKGREEDAREGSDDGSWGSWQAALARDRLETRQWQPVAEHGPVLRPRPREARQAELNRALADAGSELMAQLDEVTNQLKELVAKRRQARSAPAGGWRTSARFLADAKESLRQEGNDEVPEEHERIWREKPKTPGERAGKRRREAARKQRKKEAGAEAPQEAAPKQKRKGAGGKAPPAEGADAPPTKGAEAKHTARGTDRPAEPKGPPPPKKGPKYSKKVREAMMAFERVAKAILNAPWRNEEGGVEEEEKKKETRRGKEKASLRPKGSPRAVKGAMALAGAFRAMPKRTPKDKIIRRSQVARLTIAHKSEASFRNRQGLRRALVKKLPKGTVGVATERKLLDSDCESCKSRRGKATTSAAKAALAYAKKVRNKLEKMAHLPLMSEDEGDGETEVEVEEEDPDADHVPLGGRGVGTVFSLEGGGTGSVPSRKHPTMEVILDSGASRNVLPERVFWRLYEQGRATPLKKVSFPRRRNPLRDPPNQEAKRRSVRDHFGHRQCQRLKWVAEHEVTHIPYRSWCPACVAGRGRSYSHHHEARDSTVPVISADYLYFSEKGVPGKSLRTVVLRDRASKAIFAHLLPTKGTVGELPKDSVIFPWMIEYAGVLHTLFSQEDSEGMTPFQKLTGRTWQIALPSFGEIVDYRRRAKSKLDARWQEGVYLGLRLTSSEKIIGTPSGILVVQSIRRKPADKQFNLEMLKAAADTEGMIETIIAEERKSWIESLEGVEQPTCDLVDGLVEEILAETFYDDLTGKELPAEGVKALEGVEQPTCDLVDGLVEEILAETFYDDLTGKELPAEGVKAEEVSVIRQMGVWEIIPRPANEKVIGTRWVDINKGDSEVCLMFLDVKKRVKTSGHAASDEQLEGPEAGEGRDKVGLLKRSLYGTRDAPSNWEKAIKDALEGLGFKQGRSNPCLYFHQEKSLRLNVHGDDFTVVGSYEELKWLETELGKVWTVETRGILARPGSELPGVIHKISVLNRLVTWTHEGIEMEADPRHVDLVLEQLRLVTWTHEGIEMEADPRHVDLVLEQLGLEKGVSVTTPLVKVKDEDMDKTPLGTAEAALYRSIAMRIGYLPMDRPDLLRTVRELAKGLKEP